MIRRRFNSNKHEVFNYANYMTIEAIDDIVTVSLPRTSMYGINGIGWRRYSGMIELRKGQMLSVKDNVDSQYGNIVIKGKCNLRGNCMSLIYGDNANEAIMPAYAFEDLFKNNADIQSVDKTFLPATTLANYCYSFMFYGCTGLTTAPELPATTLADSCYSHMFQSCTYLTTAPELPATTLECDCYQFMFYDCTYLTTAPELPATTLVSRCYDSMFDECRKLNYIKMLATDISASNCLFNWVYNVSSTGTFVKNPYMTSLPPATSSNSYAGIPMGWTVQNA